MNASYSNGTVLCVLIAEWLLTTRKMLDAVMLYQTLTSYLTSQQLLLFAIVGCNATYNVKSCLYYQHDVSAPDKRISLMVNKMSNKLHITNTMCQCLPDIIASK